MSMRNGLLGLAGLLTATGAIAAKPPELPADPRVQGWEPTPIAREFHEAEQGPAVRGSLRMVPMRSVSPRPAAGTGMGKVMSEMGDAGLSRITVLLGPIPVEKE